MDIFIGIGVFILRIFRITLDVISDFIFSWFYQGKHEKLPPIKSPLLLEPAHVLAKRIRQREVITYFTQQY